MPYALYFFGFFSSFFAFSAGSTFFLYSGTKYETV